MKYLGNFYAGQTIRGTFNSRALSSGAPITLAGTPALAVYVDGNTTQTTAGITLTVDFDSRTGHHLYEIITTDAFYTRGSDFRVVLTAGTVDSVSVVGVEVGSFSIENRSDDLIMKNAFLSTRLAISNASNQSALVLTGGPTNDIADVLAIIYDASDASARIVVEGSWTGSSGTLTLSVAPGITVTTDDKVTLVAVAAESTEVAANVNVIEWGGTVVGSVTLPANVTQISGDSTAADNLEAACDGTGFNIGGGSVVAASVTGAVGSVTGNVGGNVTGSVGSVAVGGITAASIATDAIGADEIAAGAVAKLQSGLATSSSIITLSDALSASFSTVNSTLGTIASRIGAFTGTGVNTVLGFFLALLKKDATLPSDVGGTYAATTDSLEANAEALATVKKLGDRVRHTLEATSGTAGTVGAYDETTETRI